LITVEEKYLGRQLTRATQGGASVSFIIQGTDDDVAAVEALLAARPETWDGLPAVSSDVTQIAATIWEGVVNYGIQNKNYASETESVYSFETGGGNQHVTQSLATISKYAPSGKTAGDFKGAIGVDSNSVNGVDIVSPVYSWTEALAFNKAAITSTYKQTLYNLTGKVNNGTWKGYSAGEVLFMGACGSRRGNSDLWEISFKFAASPNVSNKTIGDITGIAKKGWEYLWVRYEDADDATAKVLIKKPSSVHIEQVYEEGNFTLLGV
jgi:hypothetical protein